MSFYLKKALRAGPFRFNLSKSGVGVSTGVPGFRVGLVGPRGNYVHMGRGGIYYRKSLNGVPSPHSDRVDPLPEPSAAVTQDLTGATTLGLGTSHPSELLAQLAAAEARMGAFMPVALVLGVAGIVAGLVFWPAVIAIIILGVPLLGWLRQRDALLRSVVVFYDVNDAHAAQYQALVDAFAGLRRCQQLRQVTTTEAVIGTDAFKHQSGASRTDAVAPASTALAGPRVLVTNIEIASIDAGSRSWYFLPDRLLLRDARTYAEVPYSHLQVEATAVRWIEEGSPPSDSPVVDTTWRYVNMKGGPDHRFKDNRQLPILHQARVRIWSEGGLQCVLQMSDPRAAEPFAKALIGMR